MSAAYVEALRAAELLFTPGCVVEVRVPKAGKLRTISGYFDQLPTLAKAIEQLERDHHPGIYWTLNPVPPALLSRAANRVKPYADATTNDGDILTHRWLPVDFDPIRPRDISSSEEEHEAALAMARHVREALRAEGWPEPIFADSGNGAHLLYRVDLPNNPTSTDLLRRVLLALDSRFRDWAITENKVGPGVEVDRKTFNASRIFKAYGTTARKGDHTQERPHRMSRILESPAEPMEIVSLGLLQSIAESAPDDAKKTAPQSPRRGGPLPTLDLAEFLSRHGIAHRSPVPYQGGLKYVLEHCPFNPDHKAPDSMAYQNAAGRLGFVCLHNSCTGRDWHQFREFYEGPRQERRPSPIPPPAPWPAECDSDKNPADGAAAEEGAGVPLSIADVEAAVNAACEAKDWDVAARLIPDIAKVPSAIYTLIVGKLRKAFKRDFPAKEFKASIDDLKRAAAAPPPRPEGDEEPDPDAPDLIGFPMIPLTDSGNGERLVKMYGQDIRFCPEFKKWLLWDGRRWIVDTDAGMVTQKAKNMARLLYQQADRCADLGIQRALKAHARDSESQGAITASLNRAKSEPGMSISAVDLDQHRYLLNCLNGVIDTRTGEMLAFERTYYITKLCHYEPKMDSNPAKDCPRFLKYLHWTMGETPDMGENLEERVTRMVGFLQKSFGYALTGDVSEKAAFIFYGAKGNNGKTTLLTLISTLLNEYSTQLDINTLMTSKFTDNNVRADMARLHGARFVITSEVDDGQRLSERLMKYLTAGMGKITACRKFENPFEFLATHKIFMDCNYRPEVKGADEAIWSRLKCVPFLQRIQANDPSINKQLLETLLAEGNGILAWAIRGTMRWWAERSLGDPVEVKTAGEEWRHADDPLRPFLEECCDLAPENWVRCKDFTRAYQQWCKDNSEMQLKSSRLMQRLALKGITENRSRRLLEGGTQIQIRSWDGVSLREDVTLISAPRGAYQGTNSEF